jgi:hypothetical protein
MDIIDTFPLDVLPPESLFKQWMDLYSHTEPPLSFRFSAILYALSTAIGKRVWIDLGDRKTFPCLSVLLVGPSGIGKSTSLGFSRDVLETIPFEFKPYITGLGTKEKLVKDLEVFPHTAILASELSAQLGRAKYLETLIPVLTDLMDLPAEYRMMGTKKDGPIRIKEPQITLFGCTTKEWMESQMPDAAIAGGWLPRHLVFYEDQKHQCVAIPRRLLGKDGLKKLEERKQGFQHRFLDCVRTFTGEIDFKDIDVEDLFVEWVENFQITNAALAPFQERGKEQVLKLSILIALSCQETAVSEEHLKAAIAIFEYASRKLAEVAIPFSVMGKLHNQILKNIEKNSDGLTRVQIRKMMLHSLGAKDTDKILDSLLSSEKIAEHDGRISVLT